MIVPLYAYENIFYWFEKQDWISQILERCFQASDFSIT